MVESRVRDCTRMEENRMGAGVGVYGRCRGVNGLNTGFEAPRNDGMVANSDETPYNVTPLDGKKV